MSFDVHVEPYREWRSAEVRWDISGVVYLSSVINYISYNNPGTPEAIYRCIYIQPDQIDMAVLFWYLVKSDASIRKLYSNV